MNQTPKGRIRWAVAALAIAACAALPATAGASSARSQVIVQLDAGSSADAVKAQVRAYGGRVTGDLPIINGFAAKLSDGAAALAAALRRRARGHQEHGDRAPGRQRRRAPDRLPVVGRRDRGVEQARRQRHRQGRRRRRHRHRHRRPDEGLRGEGPEQELARRRLRGHEPVRDERQGHLRPRHARRGHHRRQRHRAHQRRPAPEQVHRRRPGGGPGLGQGLRRPRQRDGARRHLRPAVRRRLQEPATTSASSTCRWSPRPPAPTRPTRSTRPSSPRGSRASSSSPPPATAARTPTPCSTPRATTPT